MVAHAWNPHSQGAGAEAGGLQAWNQAGLHTKILLKQEGSEVGRGEGGEVGVGRGEGSHRLDISPLIYVYGVSAFNHPLAAADLLAAAVQGISSQHLGGFLSVQRGMRGKKARQGHTEFKGQPELHSKTLFKRKTESMCPFLHDA